MLTLEDAYRIQNAVIAKAGPVMAWKTSLPRPEFPTLNIYAMANASPMLPGYVHESKGGSNVTITEKISDPAEKVGVELEMVYRIGRDFPKSQKVPSEEEVADAIESAHIGMEICGARWAEPKPSFLWNLADSLNNRSFIFGEGTTEWRKIDFSKLQASISVDGKEVFNKTGGHKTGNPASLAVWQVQHSVTRRDGIRKGTIVTTGQLCGNYWTPANARIRGELPTLGLAIDWTLRSEAARS